MIPVVLAVTLKDLTMILLAVLVVALVIRWTVDRWFARDDAKEVRLKGYQKIAQWCAEVKLPHCATLFECLAAYDITGVVKMLLHLVELLKDPRQRIDLLTDNFYYQLNQRVAMDADWPKILKAVQDRQAAMKAEAGRRLATIKADLQQAEAAATPGSTTATA